MFLVIIAEYDIGYNNSPRREKKEKKEDYFVADEVINICTMYKSRSPTASLNYITRIDFHIYVYSSAVGITIYETDTTTI